LGVVVSREYSDLEKAILRKLFVDRFIGKKHTAINNVPKGFKRHLHGEIKKATKRLIREGFILVKPTRYGVQVSLDPRRIAEIERIIYAS